jgi:ATP-dependent Clp protease adapter protein ClpS
MTSGIVCAAARGVVTDDSSNQHQNQNQQTLYVVTNAAMAGGMSGGPLVDANGTVLGVNALINMELRALGNYAVDATECRAFLSDLAERLAVRDENKHNNNNIATTSLEEDTDNASDVVCVLLYNDRFNKRERVSKILKEIAKLNDEEADKVMMEAHTKGRSVIREFPGGEEENARSLWNILRQEDILVEVEQMKPRFEADVGC